MSNQPHPFTSADIESPTFCVGCQTHIPRTLADQGRGLCPTCVSKINAPSAPPVTAPPPVPSAAFARPAPVTKAKRKAPWWAWALIALFVAAGISNAVNPPKEGATTPSSSASDAPPSKTPAEVAKEKRQAALSAAQAKKDAAEIAKRGPKPVPSEWDGITPEVNAYLKASLKDYDSLKIVDCSPVVTVGDDGWGQRVRYRAKNSFGGYNLSNQIFVIKQGQVVNVVGE